MWRLNKFSHKLWKVLDLDIIVILRFRSCMHACMCSGICVSVDVGGHACVHMCVQVTGHLHTSFLIAFHVFLGTKSEIESGAHPLG